MKNIKLLSLFVALFFATSAFAWSGSGIEGDPYLIQSESDWNDLATAVSGGNSYDGKYFQLTNDISVSTMIGSVSVSGDAINYDGNNRPFNGHFDGGGNTLTVTYSNYIYTAPFRLVAGGSIKHLHVAGSVTSNHKYASGLVAAIYTATTFTYTIEDCRVSVAINCTEESDANHAGFVACVTNDGSKTINIEGCLFDGKFYSSTEACGNCGGFVNGIGDKTTVNITNCLFAPAEVKLRSTGNKTFVRGDDLTHVNFDVVSGYTKILPNDYQTKHVYSIKGIYGAKVEIAEGYASKTYQTSKITHYSSHMTLNGVPYAAENDNINLSLTGASGYTTDYGTLTDNTTHYSLLMDRYNTTIKPTSITVTAKEDPMHAGDFYTTLYYQSQRFTLPNNGTEAYAAEIDGSEMKLHLIAENAEVLPENYAVVLKAPGSSIVLGLTDNVAVDVSGVENSLEGVEEDVLVSTQVPSGTCYVISGQSSDGSIKGVGFYKYASDKTLNAHKAYAVVPGGASSAPEMLQFVYEEETATAVDELTTNDQRLTTKKMLINGQLVIERDGVMYNAQGGRIN